MEDSPGNQGPLTPIRVGSGRMLRSGPSMTSASCAVPEPQACEVGSARRSGGDRDCNVVPERLVDRPVQSEFGDASVAGVPFPVRISTAKQSARQPRVWISSRSGQPSPQSGVSTFRSRPCPCPPA